MPGRLRLGSASGPTVFGMMTATTLVVALQSFALVGECR
jgi:hypothetical protein